jgi:hypothetical protein
VSVTVTDSPGSNPVNVVVKDPPGVTVLSPSGAVGVYALAETGAKNSAIAAKKAAIALNGSEFIVLLLFSSCEIG